MGLGILEDHKLAHVPGTAYMGGSDAKGPVELQLEASILIQSGEDPNLKYDRSGKVPVVLIPQPSDDPNDPLNWTLLKRDCITAVLCLVSLVASTLGPILAANTVTLKFHFGYKYDFTDVALLTGWHLCGVGVAGFLFVPTARVWGKRHLYVLGTVLVILSCVWGGLAKSYNSLMWARIIQGVAITPFEALVNVSIGDLYCVHQRGKRMALSNFALYGGAFATPIFVGKMTADINWRWTFYLIAIGGAICLPLVIFFVPETAYRRDRNTDLASTSDIALPSTAASAEPKEGHEGSQYKEDSFVQSLRLFNGRKTDDDLWRLALRPLPLLFQPAIAWGMITQGALIGWTVNIGVILGALFIGPPKFLGEERTGYTYTAAFVGALLGFVLSGLLADFTAKWMARKNNGVYEPEFRILLVIPQAIFGVIGIFGFGWTAEHLNKYSYYLPPMFFGFEVTGMVLGATSSALYLVDAHKDLAIESFTCLLLFKNFFSFCLTWYAFEWFKDPNVGAWGMMWPVGVAQICVALTSIPMYVFGKRNRSFFHRHCILKMLHLETPPKNL